MIIVRSWHRNHVAHNQQPSERPSNFEPSKQVRLLVLPNEITKYTKLRNLDSPFKKTSSFRLDPVTAQYNPREWAQELKKKKREQNKQLLVANKFPHKGKKALITPDQ